MLNEIEINGSSISFKVLNIDFDDINELFNKIQTEADQLDIENEMPGFHNYDSNGEIIRGFYSGIVPFEIEHLVDGITTKTLFKKLISCEFIITNGYVFASGDAGPVKGLSLSLCSLTGSNTSARPFDFGEMCRLENKLTKVKSVALKNGKEKEIRSARLSGSIESYTDYNVIDPRNHFIDSVSGIIDTPLGSLTLTVSQKGNFRLNVRKGFIINVELLNWIIRTITEEAALNVGLFSGDFDTETVKEVEGESDTSFEALAFDWQPDEEAEK